MVNLDLVWSEGNKKLKFDVICNLVAFKIASLSTKLIEFKVDCFNGSLSILKREKG